MVPGAKDKFGTPRFEPEVFWKLKHCVEESTCNIVGTFWHPLVIWRPVHCAPLPFLIAPLIILLQNMFQLNHYCQFHLVH